MKILIVQFFDLYVKEYPMYCILVFLIINLISFSINYLISSFLNRIKNTDFMYCIFVFLIISILCDIISLSINLLYDLLVNA